jgi:hypothetical protein
MNILLYFFQKGDCMLESAVKKYKELLVLKLNNAENLELQWEAKAYLDCINMLDTVLKGSGVETL